MRRDRGWAVNTPMPLYLTFLLMLFCFTSIASTRLVLSLYALNLGAQPLAVALLYAMFYAFPLVLSWPIGIHSDRIGSRWLLLFGTVCGSFAMLIPYLMHELLAVYIAGAMVGLSFSFYNVLLQNLVGLLSKPQERARNFSNASMVGAATNFIGPLLAGFAIDHSGNAAACLYMGTLSLTAAALLGLLGGILPGGARDGTPAGSPLGTLVQEGILRMLLTSALVQLGQDLYQLYVPIYGYALGLSGSAIGSVLATFAVAAFVVRFIMPRLIRRLGEERVLAYSFYLAATGFLLVPLFESPGALAVASFVIGLGMGCGQPITTMLIFSQSAKGRSGETLGLRQTVNNAVRMTGPALFGLLASAFGLLPVFWINAAMMGAGGWLSRRAADANSK